MTHSRSARFKQMLQEIYKIENISLREEAILWLIGEYLEGGNVPFIEPSEKEYSLEDFFCEVSVLDDYFEKYVFEDDDNAKSELIHRLQTDPFFEAVLVK